MPRGTRTKSVATLNFKEPMDIEKQLEKMHNDHKSDLANANVGSTGTNATYDKAQGNRGKLMNPTWQASQQPRENVGAGDDDLDQGDVFGSSGGDD